MLARGYTFADLELEWLLRLVMLMFLEIEEALERFWERDLLF